MSFAQSLQSLAPLQALAAALALGTLLGWRLASAASRWAVVGLGALSAGLALPGPVLHGLGLLLLSLALAAQWRALTLWLKPPPRSEPRRLAWVTVLGLPAVLALGQVALAGLPSWAGVWADAILALQLGLIARTLAQPSRASVVQGLNAWRWRLLGLAAVLPWMSAHLVRAIVAATGEPGLQAAIPTAPDLNLALAVSVQLALLLMLPVLLLAWRGEAEAELARLAQTDGLTGLMDRLAFTRRSVDHFAVARRFNEPLALMIISLDGFARLVEEHGLEAGDRALALFARALQAQMRLGDLCGRLAGQQFGVLMARSEALGPQALHERLRTTLADRAATELGFNLAFSAGWAKLRPGDRALGDLQRRAEAALYEASHAGGGVLLAEPGVAD